MMKNPFGNEPALNCTLMVQPCRDQPPQPSLDEPIHWIEIELVDEQTGDPIPWEEYRITLPDGVEVWGVLDDAGCARVDGILTPGSCKITFPRLDGEDWKPA